MKSNQKLTEMDRIHQLDDEIFNNNQMFRDLDVSIEIEEEPTQPNPELEKQFVATKKYFDFVPKLNFFKNKQSNKNQRNRIVKLWLEPCSF